VSRISSNDASTCKPKKNAKKNPHLARAGRYGGARRDVNTQRSSSCLGKRGERKSFSEDKKSERRRQRGDGMALSIISTDGRREALRQRRKGGGGRPRGSQGGLSPTEKQLRYLRHRASTARRAGESLQAARTGQSDVRRDPVQGNKGGAQATTPRGQRRSNTRKEGVGGRIAQQLSVPSRGQGERATILTAPPSKRDHGKE